MEHPVCRRDRTELASALEQVRDWKDLHKMLNGCDPAAVTTALEQTFSLDCVACVSEKRSELLACLKRWALGAFDWDIVKPTIAKSRPGTTICFSARECRCILANAFFGNIYDTMEDYKERNRGGLCFWRMMRRDCEVAAHKTAALLLYFFAGMQLEGTVDDERKVEFCHLKGMRALDFDTLLKTNHCDLLDSKPTTIDNRRSSSLGHFEYGHVRLHSGRMEDVTTTPLGFVNFANHHFGYGKFIPSCTQEEILQMCCPEFNVGMLCFAVMNDDEAVNVYNCRRFSLYTGYSNTFRCTGPMIANATDVSPIHHILTIDACFSKHYSPENILRDTRKAYTSFAALADYTERSRKSREESSCIADTMVTVSTGKWGCGNFGGTPSHKLLQQILAAKAAGVELQFSTFGNYESCDTLVKSLADRKETVSGAWKILLECPDKDAFEREFGISNPTSMRKKEKSNGWMSGWLGG